jgi:hypothetical protein
VILRNRSQVTSGCDFGRAGRNHAKGQSLQIFSADPAKTGSPRFKNIPLSDFPPVHWTKSLFSTIQV